MLTYKIYKICKERSQNSFDKCSQNHILRTLKYSGKKNVKVCPFQILVFLKSQCHSAFHYSVQY